MNPAPGVVSVDPLRPRRIWYAVAALIAAGGVLAAAAVLLLVPFGGDLGQRVTSGQPVTMHLPEGGKMVWAKVSGPDAPGVDCAPSRAEDQGLGEWHAVSARLDDLSLDADGERWRAVLTIAARPTGTYTVTCTASSGQGTVSLSIGDPPRFHDPRSKALAGLAASVLAPLGVLVGAGLAGVVAVRRRRR
ncbi:hypothetical protein [Micromonospora sp. CV4]|uniref:hypothetical protein n=1 Tax=Micromonospora sp. CV4 TaxID=2478711 RepID=UPI000EF4F04A|nr:hypothetical protein [Micromonospora sp. CV4]RLP93956.1 hypothetical protein EAD98_17345 [Micromonospora sp. CV4]